MKLKLTNKLFAFIISAMLFSALTEFANAQACSLQHSCPIGFICSNGRCVIKACNCLRRPIPPNCAASCGFLANKNEPDYIFIVSVPSNSVSKSATISFSVQQPENIAINIFDASGQLIKTFPDQVFEKGEHLFEWNTVEIKEGVYAVQLQSSAIAPKEKSEVTK